MSQGWQELPAFPGVPRVQPVSAAQLDADGQLCFYLWSGFAAPTEERDASLSVDGYVYSPAANTWTPLPEVMDVAKIVCIWKNAKTTNSLEDGDEAGLILDVTPFYAEGGVHIA